MQTSRAVGKDLAAGPLLTSENSNTSRKCDLPEQPADSVAQVAACTAAAAHRRDHHHAAAPKCHPHAVDVVHLGSRALAVCHDCEADSGFLPHRQAEDLARVHRARTRRDNSAPFPAALT